MQGTIIKHGTGGKMLRIESPDDPKPKWWLLGQFEELGNTLEVGDKVVFDGQPDNGKYTLTSLAKSDGSAPIKTEAVQEQAVKETTAQVEAKAEAHIAKTKPAPVRVEQPKPTYQKKEFDASTSIKQTCLHATSRIIIGLQGQINPDNVVEHAEKIYNALYDLITS